MKVIILSLILLLSLLYPAQAISSPETVKRYLDLLNEGNKSERELALHVLSWQLEYPNNRKGDAVFEPILKALNDKDPLIREAAAVSLKKLGEYTKGCCKETKIVASLIKALDDKEPGVRREAAAALGYYQDKRALSPLIESLKDRDPWVRLNASFALGELGEVGAIQPLLELLNDNADWRNKYVQQECLIAIRKTAKRLPYFHKQKEVVPVLAEKFGDDYLRAEIIKILKDTNICTPYITDELIRASQNPKADEKLRQKFSEEMKWPDICASQFKEKIILATQDPNEEIRKLALEALEKSIFGGTRKIEQQGEVIKVEDPALAASLKATKDPSAEVRAKAIESLGRLCPPSDPANPATEAVRGRIIETLVDALHDGNTKVKEEAISALGRIGDKRAIRPLIGVLHDSNADSQKKAAEALGKFKDEKILDELIPLLSSKEYNLRETAKATFFTIAEKTSQEQVYVYRHDGVRYCVKSRKEIPEPVKIDKDAIRFVHPNAVTMLINGLKNPDPDIRMGILLIIWKFEDARIKQTLTKLLDDPSPDVRLKAYGLLRDLGAESGIDIVIACLADKNKNVKIKAAVTLGGLRDERALQPLIKALNDPDEDVRVAVAQALGKLHDKRAIEPLIQRLQDENYNVRRATLDALANFEDPRILDANIKMLQDESPYVRRTAARNIGKKPDDRAVQPLILLLEDPDNDVPSYAAEALGKIKDSRAVEPLIRALKGEFNKNRGFEGDVHLRQKAALALGEIADQRTVPALIDALNDDQVRFCAIRSLGAIKDKQAIPTLLQVVGKRPGERSSVKKALEAYENPEMVNILIGYLDDKDNDIKKGTIQMLGEFHDPKAIVPLQRLANDPDPQIKKAGEDAIRSIKTESYPPKFREILPTGVTDSSGRGTVTQPTPSYQQTVVSTSAQPQTTTPVAPDTKNIKHLIDKLKNKDPKIRCAAADSLGESGSAGAVPYLIPLLKDENAYVRQAAARALGKLKAVDAIEPLIDRLSDSDLYVQSWTIWALGEIRDPKTIDSLTPFLYHKEQKLRDNAFEALRKFQDPRARRKMVNTLIDHATSSYSPADSMLWQLISLEGDNVILEAIKDPEDNEAQTVRTYIKIMEANLRNVSDIAKKGLKEHKDRELVISELSSFIRRVDKPRDPITVQGKIQVQRSSDANDSIRFIGELKDPRGLPILLDILKNRNTYSKSALRTAVDALGNWGYTGASDLFLEILADTNEYVGCRESAARALGKFGSEKAVKTLIDIVKNDNEKVELRIAAVHSLGDIKDKRAVEPLIAVLKDRRQDLWFRIASASALGAIGDKKAIGPLQEALKDQAVKNAAQGALQKMAVSQ